MNFIAELWRSSPVQHIEVQPGEHALARSSRREAAPASHHHVQHTEGDEVRVLVAAALQADHHVSQLRHRGGAQRYVRQILLHLVS